MLGYTESDEPIRAHKKLVLSTCLVNLILKGTLSFLSIAGADLGVVRVVGLNPLKAKYNTNGLTFSLVSR